MVYSGGVIKSLLSASIYLQTKSFLPRDIIPIALGYDNACIDFSFMWDHYPGKQAKFPGH